MKGQKHCVTFALSLLSLLTSGCTTLNVTSEPQKSATSATKNAILSKSITGRGKIYYSPDVFDITFGANTTGRNLQEAREQHLGVLDKIQEYVAGMSRDKYILTKLPSKLTILRPDEEKNRQYAFESLFILRVRDVSSIMAVFGDLVSLGANIVKGTDLILERPQEIVNKARALAIQDAKNTMNYLAKELGLKSISLEDLSFDADRWHSSYRQSDGPALRGWSGSDDPLILNNYLEATVNARFNYEK